MSFFAKDIAIDLGTANTLVYVKGQGILVDEPTVVTLEKSTDKVVGVGNDARDLAGRLGDDFVTCRPFKDGVIDNFDVASSVIQFFLRKVSKGAALMRPRVVVTVPSGITMVERRALREAARAAGAGKVFMMYQSVAAALGTGLRVDRPKGHMVVDIGGGTTEVAVVCKYTTACSESLRVAGDEINQAIRHHMHHQHRVEISEVMAEAIKIKIGSAAPLRKKQAVRFRGKDIATGMPRLTSVSDDEIREAIKRQTTAIVESVKRVLERTSPDLASDISETGIWLTGGGALLKGWRRLFYEKLGVEVQVSQDPLRSTIRGAGAVTEQFDFYRNVLFNGYAPKYSDS